MCGLVLALACSGDPVAGVTTAGVSAIPQSLRVFEDGALVVHLSATTDVPLEVVDPPDHGSLAGTPPDLLYTPEPDFFGDDRSAASWPPPIPMAMP